MSGAPAAAAPAGSVGRTVAALGRLLIRASGWRAAVVASGLVLAAGFTDGVGLFLLVPLLQTLDGHGAGGAVAGWVARLFGLVGLVPTLPGLMAVFLALVGLRSVLVRGRDLALARIRLQAVSELRVRLYRAVAGASWPFLAGVRASDLSAALLGEVDRVGQGTYFALQFPARALGIVVHLAVAFALAPGFSALALATGVGLAWAVRGRMAHSLRLGGALAEANRGLHGDVAEFLAAVKVTKAHAAEARHVAAFSARVATIARRMLDFTRGTANARLVQEVAGAVAMAAFLWAAATLAHLPVPRLLPLVLVFYRLLPLAQEVQQAMQQILYMLPSLAAVLATCRQCEDHAESGGEDGEGSAPLAVTRGIRLDGVWFAHGGPDGGPGALWVLRGVDLELPAGSLTVVTGPSGVGKSTLLDLLAGLLMPARGRLLVDGRPLAALPAAAWRRSIAYVPQDSVLFHDTIRANLLWMRPGASEAELAGALAAAAADFVHALPQGLDTVVGDRGLRLSGGERQRLALARALLRRPALLILDEATAALDVGNESLVADAIRRLGGTTTTLVVTHRPQAFAFADQRLALSGGRLEPAADPARV